MQLSKFSDYSFRALIYLAKHASSLNTVENMAKDLHVSQNHLKKIIHNLSKGHFIESFKGRDGGIRLAKKPEEINLAAILLYTENYINNTECIKNNDDTCPYHEECNLKAIANHARGAFINEFKKYHLSDLLS